MFFLKKLTPTGLVLALLLMAGVARAQTAEIVSFTPQGEVRRIQQVAIRFSADMVRLGEGDAPAPITVNCPQGASEPGKGRWVDTRRYVVDGYRCPRAHRHR